MQKKKVLEKSLIATFWSDSFDKKDKTTKKEVKASTPQHEI